MDESPQSPESPDAGAKGKSDDRPFRNPWIRSASRKLKLLSCEIFYRELCAAVSRSPNRVDIEFLPKGLHDIGSAGMVSRLQEAVDRTSEGDHEAILLGYGLCNNGLVGLRARKVPIVVPRAHDCIALFLGSRHRYGEYFDSHPGVYFLTSGWIERGSSAGELQQQSIGQQSGMTMSYEELVSKYGEDNARFLYDQLCDVTRNYGQFTFIEMGVEPSGAFELQAREEAERRGWKFERIAGDMSLLQKLVDGPWDEKDFLVIQPGCRVKATYDEDVISSAEGEP